MPHIGGSHNALHCLQLTFSPDDNPQVFSSLISGGNKKGRCRKLFRQRPFGLLCEVYGQLPRPRPRPYFWKKALTRSVMNVTSSSVISVWMGSESTSRARRTDSAMLPHVRATHL